MFYFFDELGSTIDEARDEKYAHGDVVAAEYQTSGRGQRGTEWAGAAGKNLMFSVILDTSFLRATEQFLLLQVVALALVDTFAAYGLDAKIKWTNDIYIGDRKITGVLIDHSVSGGRLVHSGVGVGINVNQTEFDGLPNPTSMALETGREHDRNEVLQLFYEKLMTRFDTLRYSVIPTEPDRATRNLMQSEYHSKIYRLGIPAPFALPDGERFTGTIRGVAPTGELLIDTGAEIKSFLFREVGFIIES